MTSAVDEIRRCASFLIPVPFDALPSAGECGFADSTYQCLQNVTSYMYILT